MRIYLDGNEITYPEDNVLLPSFTIRKKDENGDKAFSFTGDLAFRGPDYTYLYGKLVTDANALTNEVVLKFVDNCCDDFTAEFTLAAENIRWCENECVITGNAIERSVEREQIICLRNKLIWDDTYGFKSMQHPRFSYCNEIRPNWLHDVILLLVIISHVLVVTLTPIVVIFALLVLAVNLIIAFLNGFPNVDIDPIDLDGDPNTNVFQEIKNLKDDVVSWAVGCGRKHPSPLIRDYAKNVCKVCGIAFSSTIFDDPASHYFNACYHNAPVHKGVPVNGTDPHNGGADSNDYWIEKNAPLLNGIKFFDQICGTFNAEWKIRNNVLYLERRDYFQNQTPWLDLNQLEITDYTICYNWSKKQRYAYGNFEYQKDAVNTCGSEANRRWSDIVEWNSPYSPKQKGEFKPNIEFTSCRFRDDGLDRDVLTFYKTFPFIGPEIQKWDDVIILSQHTCFTPMILIMEPTSQNGDARVNKNYNPPGNTEAGANQFYNYPMWLWEHGNVGIYGDYSNNDNNLYTNFWYIENPRLNGFLGLDYVATVSLSCDRLNAIDVDGMINTPSGLGKINEIEINYAANTIQIKGTC